jgi:hypothetical protein
VSAKEEALKIINNERQDAYGNPEDSFQKIARYWNAYLQNRDSSDLLLNEKDVCLMMVLFKLAREQGPKHKKDNVVDAIGYLDIYAERLTC